MVADPRVNRPLFARFYAWVSPGVERAGMAAYRQQLLARLEGAVIEVGAGHGLNFAHYPPTVSRVTAVEPDPYLRDLAHSQTAAAPVPVTVVDGVAERLPAADGSYDAAVVCLVLCSLVVPHAATAELARVLRPGGQVRFFEHVRAQHPVPARLQRLLDATVWPRITGGCHTARDPLAAFEQAGFALGRVSRVRFPDGPVPTPTAPHLLGVASKPGQGGAA